MRGDFLLEIGTEELPAGELISAKEQLKTIFADFLKEYRINYTQINTYATPRRLVVYIKELSDVQEPTLKTIIGPPKNIAFFNNQINNPTPSLIGFLKKYKLTTKDITIKEIVDNKRRGEYIVCEMPQEGKSTKELLSINLPILIKKIKFSKSMRWAEYNIYFSRPIRWIFSLFSGEVLQFELDGIKSSDYTFGHKILSYKKIRPSSPAEYFNLLEENYVIVDNEKRLNLVNNILKHYKNQENLIPGILPSALEELIYSIENQAVIEAVLPKDYKSLPPEVITTILSEQRCIPLINEETSELDDKFLILADSDIKFGENIRRGYEYVINAKIQDALFFQEEDRHKSPKELLDLLSGIVFHQDLGSMLEKAERISDLSVYISNYIDKSLAEVVRVGGYFAKADLSTTMVFEYPQLQGIIGYYYARDYWGLAPQVAEAIKEHKEFLPNSKAAAVVSLADKLDTLVGFFSIGITPTGSQDLYGLRRLAQSIINTIIFHEISAGLSDWLCYSMNLFGIKDKTKREELLEVLINHLKTRIYNLLLDEGIDSQVAKSVIEGIDDRPYDIYLKAKAVEELMKKNNDFVLLTLCYKRINNIIKEKEPKECVEFREGLLKEEAERELFEVYLSSQFHELYYKKKDYSLYLSGLLELKPHLDKFFDNVLINCEDINLRENRYGLLLKLRELYLNIADFSVFKI